MNWEEGRCLEIPLLGMIMRKRLELCLESSSDGKRKLMSSRNSLTCTEAAPLPPLWTVPLAPLPEGFSAAEGPVKMMADDLDAEEATHVPGSDNVGGEVMQATYPLNSFAHILLVLPPRTCVAPIICLCS
ncbi:hypothetical protein F2Q68_00014169 [Brassica cretica]|uniref:Uncharacterized protein n=2 Tax=Brassica cretica TaxID=69181 RepID=A0A8S9HQ03_BRACR|nr:hypothetical protein F2Q68_00014169 [Brassica cretica]KAF3605204.1 hypothetical protein DY000_02046525 [Brassica cretica]